jgi:hypothetical protein
VRFCAMLEVVCERWREEGSWAVVKPLEGICFAIWLVSSACEIVRGEYVNVHWLLWQFSEMVNRGKEQC